MIMMIIMMMIMMMIMVYDNYGYYDDDCFDDDFDDAHDRNDDDVYDDNTDDELTCEQHLFCKLSCEQCDYDGFELTCEHKYFCEVLVVAVCQIPPRGQCIPNSQFPDLQTVAAVAPHGQFFVKLMFKDDNDCLVSSKENKPKQTHQNVIYHMLCMLVFPSLHQK